MYDDKTPEAIRQDILDNAGAGISTEEGSFLSDMAAPTALELSYMYGQLDRQLEYLFIEKLAVDELDKRASEYGVTRKPGAKATGTLTITGDDGTVVPAGTVIMTQDNYRYTTDADAAIASGTVDVAITAEAIGTAYNASAQSITVMYKNQAGVDAITNAAALINGVDEETDDALKARLLARIQTPATSGNAYHYKNWALEVNGVGDAKVTPLWNGNGTVKVLIVGNDKEPVNASVVSACAAYIETVRPIGASVTVESATGTTINVAATVVLSDTAVLADVQAAFEAAVEDYVQDAAFEVYTISINKIAYLLMSVPGVTNYTALTVNSAAADVVIAAGAVPVKGTVVLSESV